LESEANRDNTNAKPVDNPESVTDPHPVRQLFIDNPSHPEVPDLPQRAPCRDTSSEVEKSTVPKAAPRSPSLEIVSPDAWMKRQKPKVMVELSSDTSYEEGEYSLPKLNNPSSKPDPTVKVERPKVATMTAPREPMSMRTRSRARVPAVRRNRIELDMRSLDGTEKQLLSRTEHSIKLEQLLNEGGLDSSEYTTTRRKLANIQQAMSSICSKLEKKPGYDKTRLEAIAEAGKIRAKGLFFHG
jgi:hypothetical protein